MNDWQETISLRYDLSWDNVIDPLARYMAEIVNAARENGFLGDVSVEIVTHIQATDVVVTVRFV